MGIAAMTVVDLPPNLPDGGRSTDILSACRDGTSTIVWALRLTVVDPVWPTSLPSNRAGVGRLTCRHGHVHLKIHSEQSATQTPRSRRFVSVDLDHARLDRPPSTQTARRWSIHRRDTPAECR